MKIVARPRLLKQFHTAALDASVRLIHVYGIPGAGKTTLIGTLRQLPDARIVWLSARDKASLTLEALLEWMARHFLPAEVLEEWRRVVEKAVSLHLVRPGDYSKITLNVEGHLQADRIIVGDVFEMAQDESAKVVRLQLEIGWKELIARLPAGGRHFITIDSAEDLDAAHQLVAWLETAVLARLEGGPRLTVVVGSRESRAFNCDMNALRPIEVGPLDVQEAIALCQAWAVTDRSYVEFISTVTKRHALALVLALQIAAHADLRQVPGLSIVQRLNESLIVQVLNRHVLETERDEVLRQALLKLPFLRLILPEIVASLLSLEEHQVGRVLGLLLRRGYIERVGSLYKYHDLLRELTLDHCRLRWGMGYCRDVNVAAAGAFAKLPARTYERVVIRTTQQFYHEFAADPVAARPYFERQCKAALDRKDRVLSGVLVSDIDYQAMPDGPGKGWYLLRHGGYFREFRIYPKALELFATALAMVEDDRELRARLLNNIAVVHLYHEPERNREQAIRLFKESSLVAGDITDIHVRNLNNLGIAYERGGPAEIEQAIEYYRQSLEISEAGNADLALVAGKSHRNLGLIYQRLNRPAESLGELGLATAFYRKGGAEAEAGEALYHAGGVLLQQGDYPAARERLDEALACLTGKSSPHYLSANFFSLAQVLKELGEISNMRQCLVSTCSVGLDENWECHEAAVANVVQFLRYVTACDGAEATDATIRAMSEAWEAEESLRAVPLVRLLTQMVAPEHSSAVGWSTARDETMHVPASRCRPRKWAEVRLQNPASAVTKQYCPRCAAIPAG